MRVQEFMDAHGLWGEVAETPERVETAMGSMRWRVVLHRGEGATQDFAVYTGPAHPSVSLPTALTYLRDEAVLGYYEDYPFFDQETGAERRLGKRDAEEVYRYGKDVHDRLCTLLGPDLFFQFMQEAL